MGNKKDGSNSKTHYDKITAYTEEEIAEKGNEDTKKLYSVYKELAKDGLTNAEMEKLKTLDQTLRGADFACLEGAGTLIAQVENREEIVFVVPNGKQKHPIVNSKN